MTHTSIIIYKPEISSHLQHLALGLYNLTIFDCGGSITAGSKIEALKKIPFFNDMSEYDLHQIDQITVERNFRAGEIIIQEQTKAAGFFIIDSGKVEISKKFSDGEEMVLGIHSDGEFFGEMALLAEGLRSATVRALMPTRILEISSRDFENLLYKAPVLAYSLVKEISSSLRETGALMVSYLQRKNRELSQAYLDTVAVIVQNIEARRIGNTTGRMNNYCCRCF